VSDADVITDEEIDRILSQQTAPPTTVAEAQGILQSWYPEATIDSFDRIVQAAKAQAGDAWTEYTEDQAREMDFAEITPDDVANILDTTIARDRTNKKILYNLAILNYTDADQHNIGFSSASSTGKTHIALEVMKYFPKEDVKALGYVSKQAFFHEDGVLVTEDGKPLETRRTHVSKGIEDFIETYDQFGARASDKRKTQERKRLKAEWEDIPKRFRIDFHQKILVFLDQPSDELLARLRPLASHDKKSIILKITDRSTSGSNRTKTIEIIGWPTFIHLTTGFSADEQERTRFVLLSAEVSQEKIKDALVMVAHKVSDRQAFADRAEYHPLRHQLCVRTKFIKYANIKQITVPESIRDNMIDQFLTERGFLAPRALRDFPHLIALTKANALINLFQRDIINDCVIATEADAKIGLKLYNEIADSNELGIPPVSYEFWKKKIEPNLDGEGLTRADLRRMHYEYFKHRVSDNRLKAMIDNFCEVGLVIELPDLNDRRQKRIYPLDIKTEEQDALGGAS